MAFEIFGFKIERTSQETSNANVPAFTLPESDDGSMMVSGAGAAGYSLDTVSYTHLTLPTKA